MGAPRKWAQTSKHQPPRHMMTPCRLASARQLDTCCALQFGSGSGSGFGFEARPRSLGALRKCWRRARPVVALVKPLESSAHRLGKLANVVAALSGLPPSLFCTNTLAVAHGLAGRERGQVDANAQRIQYRLCIIDGHIMIVHFREPRLLFTGLAESARRRAPAAANFRAGRAPGGVARPPGWARSGPLESAGSPPLARPSPSYHPPVRKARAAATIVLAVSTTAKRLPAYRRRRRRQGNLDGCGRAS